MPDEHRGAIERTLAGEKLTFRLALSGIRLIEEQSSTSIQTLTRRAILGDLRIDDVAVILWGALHHDGVEKPPDYEAVAEMVFEDGLVEALPIAKDLMLIQYMGLRNADQISKIVEEGGTEKPKKNPRRNRKTSPSTGTT